MAIVKQGSTTLNSGAKGDKGDAGTGGITNPKAVIVESQVDFIGVNKDFYISADFTLSSNLTIPDGGHLVANGGIMTLSTYDIDGTNLSFGSDKNDTFIDIGQAGTINDNATFKTGDINLNWLGFVGDGNVVTNTGYDNWNIFIQAMKIFNPLSGHVTLPKAGNYMSSQVTPVAFNGGTPTGWHFLNSASFELGKNVKLGALTNNLANYHFITFFGSQGGFMKGGEVVGDLRTHQFVGQYDEDCWGITVAHNSRHVTISTPAVEFSGDCITPIVTTNAVYSSAGRVTPGDSSDKGLSNFNFEIAQGGAKDFIIEDDGTKTADSNFAYSKFFEVTSGILETGNIFIYGYYGSAGTGGFKSNTMYIAYYSDVVDGGTGEFTFIERTELVESYQLLPLKPEYKNFRVIIHTPVDWNAVDGSVFAPYIPLYTTYNPPYVKWGVRQGMSNISPYSRVTGVLFDMNGKRFSGETGSPGYHIDIEDFYQGCNNIAIDNCTFGNANNGIIIAKGTKYLKFHDNVIPYATDPTYQGRGVSFFNSHDTQVYNNTIRGAFVQLGRRGEMYNNMLLDTNIRFSFEGDTFRNHTNAYNVSFRTAEDVPNVDGSSTDYPSVSYVKDNVFVYDKPLEIDKSVILLTGGGQIVWENNVFDFGGETFDSTHLLSNVIAGGAEISRGYVDNFKIINLLPNGSFGTTPLQWVAQNINKMEIPFGLDIRAGLPQNLTLSNSKIGYFHGVFNSYPITNAGDFTTYTIKNTIIEPLDNTYVGGASFALDVAQVDLDLVVEDSEINLRFDINGNFFIYLKNYGTKVFKNTKFYSDKVGGTLNLNTYATNGAVTFIDCEFTNITFTLRAGDKILYTKAHPNLEVFTDNAAAIAGGIPTGYMYRTATGEVRMVYTP